VSASTAQLDSPSWLATLRERLTPARVAESGNGRVYALLAALSLAFAAFSLLYPSTPTYDPWAWIIWGREIAHFDLQTTGGPSWKPFPVIFTTVFSIFGGAAPDLWLIVARAGAVMAVLVAFRLAARLTGGALVARLAAGTVAAVALIISSQFVRTMALGDSEGLLVAFVLWGIERHLDGRYRQAFVLGFLAALLRPEVWPFLGLYGAWLWLIDRDALRLVIAGFVLVPALWLLPELWGSGNLWRAADRAQQPNPNSPAFAKHPFVKVIQNTWPLVITPVKAAAGFAIVLAAIDWVRSRRQGAVLAVTGLALAWILLIAVMTQAGFSGNPRYIILGTSVLAVIGGVGFGRVVQLVGGAVGRVNPTAAVAAGVAAVLLLAVATSHWALPRIRNFDQVDHALRFQAELRFDLEDALARAGGAKAFAACGHAATGKFQVPMLAWHLHEHSLEIGLGPAPRGVVSRSRSTGRAPFAPPLPYPPGYRQVAHVRTTTLYSTCPAAPGATPGA
jgi:MFS family permease